MEPRAYESDAAGTPPAFPETATLGYPQEATPTIAATIPGAWWAYMLGEEVRNMIIKGGVVPSPYNSGQVLQSLLNIRAAQ